MHQKQIDELLSAVGDLTDDYFSKEEAELMRKRLDDLEVRVRDAAESGAKADEAMRARIDAMASTIEMLKVQVSVLSKKSWWRLLAGRAASWMSEPANRQLVRSGIDLAKELVGGKDETPRLGQ
jgi:hypothetical protein